MVAVSLLPRSPFSPLGGFIESLYFCNSTSLGLLGAFVWILLYVCHVPVTDMASLHTYWALIFFIKIE
jgi:hypothetical protein